MADSQLLAWAERYVSLCFAHTEDDDEGNAWIEEQIDLRVKLGAMPPTTMAGAAAHVRWMLGDMRMFAPLDPEIDGPEQETYHYRRTLALVLAFLEARA